MSGFTVFIYLLCLECNVLFMQYSTKLSKVSAAKQLLFTAVYVG